MHKQHSIHHIAFSGHAAMKQGLTGIGVGLGLMLGAGSGVVAGELPAVCQLETPSGYARHDTTFECRARFDQIYVEQASFANDLALVIKTPLAMLRGS